MNLLEYLESRGLELSSDGDAVRLRGLRSVVTDDVRRAVREHKDELVEALFDREERAALQGCPEWMDAGKWARVAAHPAILELQRQGLCHAIVEVTGGGSKL